MFYKMSYKTNNLITAPNISYDTQDDLLLTNLMDFYKNEDNLNNMLKIITGESTISLRIVDWFATNYAKKNFTLYDIDDRKKRFKVYEDYKLKLKAYSKKGLIHFVDGKESAFLIKKIQVLKQLLDN